MRDRSKGVASAVGTFLAAAAGGGALFAVFATLLDQRMDPMAALGVSAALVAAIFIAAAYTSSRLLAGRRLGTLAEGTLAVGGVLGALVVLGLMASSALRPRGPARSVRCGIVDASVSPGDVSARADEARARLHAYDDAVDAADDKLARVLVCGRPEPTAEAKLEAARQEAATLRAGAVDADARARVALLEELGAHLTADCESAAAWGAARVAAAPEVFFGPVPVLRADGSVPVVRADGPAPTPPLAERPRTRAPASGRDDLPPPPPSAPGGPDAPGGTEEGSATAGQAGRPPHPGGQDPPPLLPPAPTPGDRSCVAPLVALAGRSARANCEDASADAALAAGGRAPVDWQIPDA